MRHLACGLARKVGFLIGSVEESVPNNSLWTGRRVAQSVGKWLSPRARAGVFEVPPAHPAWL